MTKKPRTDRSLNRQRIKLVAARLAPADFMYLLGEKATSDMLGIDEKDAKKARKTPEYASRIKELEEDYRDWVSQAMQGSAEKLKMAMSSLVPKSIEVINRSLDDPKSEVALRAAQEVLDRDGRMPKVSKVQGAAQESSAIPDVDPVTAEEFKKHIQ